MAITIGDAIKEQAPELLPPDEDELVNAPDFGGESLQELGDAINQAYIEANPDLKAKVEEAKEHPRDPGAFILNQGEEQQISCDTCGYKDSMVCQSCKDMSLYNPHGDATCGQCQHIWEVDGCVGCEDHSKLQEAQPKETVQQDLEGNTLPPVTSEVETQRYKTWRTGKYHIKVKLTELEKVLDKGQSAVFQFIYRKMKPEKGTNITPELIAKEAVILYDAIRWG